MRCAGMTTFSRCVWPIVLTFAAGPGAAFAESFACYPVQRGDTASRLAQRITGDASNTYQPWFDMVDLSARSVPESQYDRIRSGWLACVLEPTVQGRALARQVVTAEATRRLEPRASAPSAIAPRTSQDAFPPSVVPL